MRRALARGLLAATATVVALVLAYLAWSANRTRGLYSYVKTRQRGWSGHVHRPDPELGYVPIPGTTGSHVFPVGDDIPMRYDGAGFRVPVQGPQTGEPHPLVLALGCSFTYGDAVLAEEAFPYLVATGLHGSVRNAGVTGYGLAQMTVLARRLIPRLRPDVVLVQYSPWLVDRGLSPFSPSYFGRRPVPYFSAADPLTLAPPVFLTRIFDLPIDAFRRSPRGPLDLLRFTRRVGLPLFLHDDARMLGYFVRRALGDVPEPSGDREGVVRAVYREIARTAERHGAVPVIVVLDGSVSSEPPRPDLFPPSTLVVDAQRALVARLTAATTAEYVRRYAHWRGRPPRVVDPHPNAEAHRVIAAEILGRLAEVSFGRRSGS